jgi:hypothetical protein
MFTIVATSVSVLVLTVLLGIGVYLVDRSGDRG